MTGVDGKVAKDLVAVERLVTICRLLGEHPDLGLGADALVAAVQYHAAPRDQRTMLGRDIRHLNDLGLRIVNTAPVGAEGHYRLIPGDDRFRVWLTPQERAALSAVVAAGEADSVDVPPPAVRGALDDVQRAVSTNAVLRFTYSGRPRVLHPYGMSPGSGTGWRCHGWEEGPDAEKSFAVPKMKDLAIDAPNTARAPVRSGIPTMDPFRFAIDPVAIAQLRVSEMFLADVLADLPEPHAITDAELGPDGTRSCTMTYEVTNHQYFTHRLIRLGERVVLLGDDVMRARLRTMLDALAMVD